VNKLGLEADSSHTKLNIWTEPSASSGPAPDVDTMDDDVNAMAIEGAVVPRDLLSSSTEGSVDEAETSTKKDTPSVHRGGQRRRNANGRRGAPKTDKNVPARRRKKVYPKRKHENSEESPGAAVPLDLEVGKDGSTSTKPPRNYKSRPHSKQNADKRGVSRRKDTSSNTDETGRKIPRKNPSTRPRTGGAKDRRPNPDSTITGEASKTKKHRRPAQKHRPPRKPRQQQTVVTAVAS